MIFFPLIYKITLMLSAVFSFPNHSKTLFCINTLFLYSKNKYTTHRIWLGWPYLIFFFFFLSSWWSKIKVKYFAILSRGLNLSQCNRASLCFNWVSCGPQVFGGHWLWFLAHSSWWTSLYWHHSYVTRKVPHGIWVGSQRSWTSSVDEVGLHLAFIGEVTLNGFSFNLKAATVLKSPRTHQQWLQFFNLLFGFALRA